VSQISKRVFNQPDHRAGANATKSSHYDDGYMILIVHSGRSGKAFLTLTKDEIYAMTCAEEGTPKIVVCPSYMRLKWLCP